MSVPQIVRILLNMQAALQAISTTSGYNNTFLDTSVILDPKNLQTLPLTETPIICLGHRIDPQSRDFTGSRPNAVKETWRIYLEVILDVANDLDDNSKKVVARYNMAQDIERALMVDPTRAGLAMYTYVQQDSAWPDVDSQNRLYMEIPVDVLMQRVYGVV